MNFKFLHTFIKEKADIFKECLEVDTSICDYTYAILEKEISELDHDTKSSSFDYSYSQEAVLTFAFLADFNYEDFTKAVLFLLHKNDFIILGWTFDKQNILGKKYKKDVYEMLQIKIKKNYNMLINDCNFILIKNKPC